MKSFPYASFLAALLMSFGAASRAHADWLSSLTYRIAVSSSPSGPFGTSVNLWSPSLPPGYAPAMGIDLAAATNPAGFVLGGNALLPLGLLRVNFGVPDVPPVDFPEVPFAFQVTPHGKKSRVLSGQLSIVGYGNVSFANGGVIAVNTSHGSFDVTLEAIQRPIPLTYDPVLPPGSSIGEYDIYAAVPLSGLTQAPEPSTLVLAGMGAFGFIAASKRRRWKARSSPVGQSLCADFRPGTRGEKEAMSN
jgi:hypothetical protein